MTSTTDTPLVADPAYAVPASRDRLERAAEALIARGMDARVVADGAAARSEFDRLVPDGALAAGEAAPAPRAGPEVQPGRAVAGAQATRVAAMSPPPATAAPRRK